MPRILHLSDTHDTASGRDMDGADARGALARMLYDARHLEDLDLVVVSGDLADDGSIEGCRAVRDAVMSFAAARSVPAVFGVGNHDDRAAFREVFGSGHLAPDGSAWPDVVCGPTERCAAAGVMGGLRVVALDSLVPGQTHGELGADQLTWLRDVLAEPSPGGSVVVVHHPPAYLSEAMRAVCLRDGERLAEELAGRDVHAVLAGHLHHELHATLPGGIPLVVTPGIVTRIDRTAPAPLERAVVGAGATVVDLGGPFSPMTHVLWARQPDVGTPVYLYDPVADDLVEEPVGEPG